MYSVKNLQSSAECVVRIDYGSILSSEILREVIIKKVGHIPKLPPADIYISSGAGHFLIEVAYETLQSTQAL